MLISTERVLADGATSAMDGRIVPDPVRILWLGAHLGLSVVALVWFADPAAIAACGLLTAITICAGHSVGMHRLLIHRSFKTHRALEYLLVWLGTLVGMAGPMGMIAAHDMRDWHQRQTECPAHPSHGAGFWRDAWWQLGCTFRLAHPPRLRIEPRVAQDPVYRVMDATWMWQQLPIALGLYALGGVGWVLWGVSVRICLSLIGHWMVGHFAHRTGHQGWRVDGVAVQGYNLPRLGLITFGESWHGNHHAFPGSALLGVEPGQADPGFALIRVLERLGLAWDVQVPGSSTARAGLRRVPQ